MDLSSTAVDCVVGRDSISGSREDGGFTHGTVLLLSSNGPTLEPTSVTGAQESSELNMARETWTCGLVDGNEVTLAGWNKGRGDEAAVVRSRRKRGRRGMSMVVMTGLDPHHERMGPSPGFCF